MAFKKAVQHTNPVAYAEYIKELMLYKTARKRYEVIRKSFSRSQNPAEQLLYYKAKDEHSEACRRYFRAKETYKIAQVEERLRDQGVEPGLMDTDDIMRIAQVHIPVSTDDLIFEAKQRATIASLGGDAGMEALRERVEAEIEKRKEAEKPFDFNKYIQPSDSTEPIALIDLDTIGDKPAAIE